MLLQRLVHLRARYPPDRKSEQAGFRSGAGQHNRFRRDAFLLPRFFADLSKEGERHTRVLQHHPDHEAVQTDAPLPRSQDPHTHLQGERTRTQSARLLPRPLHRRLRFSRLLRRTNSDEPRKRLHVDPRRTLVGHRYHDDGWLWRHDPKDVSGNVRRVDLRPHRRSNDRPSRSRHRQQLCPLLLTHAGKGEASEEAAEGLARRGRATQGPTGSPPELPWYWSTGEQTK